MERGPPIRWPRRGSGGPDPAARLWLRLSRGLTLAELALRRPVLPLRCRPWAHRRRPWGQRPRPWALPQPLAARRQGAGNSKVNTNRSKDSRVDTSSPKDIRTLHNSTGKEPRQRNHDTSCSYPSTIPQVSPPPRTSRMARPDRKNNRDPARKPPPDHTSAHRSPPARPVGSAQSGWSHK